MLRTVLIQFFLCKSLVLDVDEKSSVRKLLRYYRVLTVVITFIKTDDASMCFCVCIQDVL
jgi:hypothetical protein